MPLLIACQLKTLRLFICQPPLNRQPVTKTSRFNTCLQKKTLKLVKMQGSIHLLGQRYGGRGQGSRLCRIQVALRCWRPWLWLHQDHGENSIKFFKDLDCVPPKNVDRFFRELSGGLLGPMHCSMWPEMDRAFGLLICPWIFCLQLFLGQSVDQNFLCRLATRCRSGPSLCSAPGLGPTCPWWRRPRCRRTRRCSRTSSPTSPSSC